MTVKSLYIAVICRTHEQRFNCRQHTTRDTVLYIILNVSFAHEMNVLPKVVGLMRETNHYLLCTM